MCCSVCSLGSYSEMDSCIKHQLGTVFVIDTCGREWEKAGQREELSWDAVLPRFLAEPIGGSKDGRDFKGVLSCGKRSVPLSSTLISHRMWQPSEMGNFSAQAIPKKDRQWRAVCLAVCPRSWGESAKEDSEWHLVSSLNHMTFKSSASTQSLCFFF